MQRTWKFCNPLKFFFEYLSKEVLVKDSFSLDKVLSGAVL
jgi:hypothetical protein